MAPDALASRVMIAAQAERPTKAAAVAGVRLSMSSPGAGGMFVPATFYLLHGRQEPATRIV